MSHEPTNPPQPPLPGVPAPQTNKEGMFAPVLCYDKAGEPPREFKVPVKKKFFSLADDFDFLNETAFLEVPFKIYDCMIGQFTSIPPSAFWRYPSPINPFYLVKDGRIKDHDCPDLQYYTDILSDTTQAHFDTLPRLRSSSPLPPSSPPPPSPRVEYAEKKVQTVEAAQPKKRKASDPQSEVAGRAPKVRRTAKFEVNLHIHCAKDGHLPKKGTGNSVDDPIVV